MAIIYLNINNTCLLFKIDWNVKLFLFDLYLYSLRNGLHNFIISYTNRWAKTSTFRRLFIATLKKISFHPSPIIGAWSVGAPWITLRCCKTPFTFKKMLPPKRKNTSWTLSFSKKILLIEQRTSLWNLFQEATKGRKKQFIPILKHHASPLQHQNTITRWKLYKIYDLVLIK